MAEQSLLAKLGLRLGVLGTAANLMIAAPLSNGDPSMAAHTDATRIGMYVSRATNNGILGLVVGGVETLDIQGDGAVTWIGTPTVSAPALSPANKGSIYYDRTAQAFLASGNGGTYSPFGLPPIGAANTVLTSSGTAPQWSTSINLAGSVTAASILDIAGRGGVGAAGLPGIHDNVRFIIGGSQVPSTTGVIEYGMVMLCDITGNPNQNIVGGMIRPASMVKAASGTHPLMVNWLLTPPVASPSGAASVADTAMLYISGVFAETVSGANYAIWQASTGKSRYDGNVDLTGNSANQTAILTCKNFSAGAYGTLFAEGASGDGITDWANSFVVEAVPGTSGNLVLGAYTGQIVFQTSARVSIARFTTAGTLLIGTATDDLTNLLQVNGGIRTRATTDSTSATVGALLSSGGLGVALSTNFGVATQWTGIATVSAPTLSGANNGKIYYDRTSQAFFASLNGGAYAPFGGSGITGLTSGRVPFANSSTTLTDSAQMTFATANGLSINRITSVAGGEFFGFNAGNTTVLTGIDNTVLGNTAGHALTSGSDNAFIGFNAAMLVTTGSFSVAVGSQALAAHVSGDRNIAVGYQALTSSTGGVRNTAIGYHAVGNLQTGTDNTGIGNSALSAIDTSGAGGSQMTAVGSGAMQGSNFNSLRDVAVGYNALSVAGQPIDCVAVGHQAAVGMSAARCTAVGSNALGAAGGSGPPSDNTAIGYNAGGNLTTATTNTFVGSSAGANQGTVSNQVALGYQALLGNATPSNNSGTQNTAVGYQALTVNSSGSANTALGYLAGANLTTGGTNTFIGSAAGQFQLAGTQLVALGDSALTGNSTPANNTGTQNTAIGSQALKTNTSGGTNVAVGTNTSRLSTTASDNTIIGALAGANVTTGGQNTFVGSNAGGTQQAVVGLVAVGYQALLSTIGSATGTQCTAIGTQTLKANTTGSDNTTLGFQAGTNLTTGSNHTFLGSTAGSNQLAVSSLVAVGYQAMQGNGTPANNTGTQSTAVGYQALKVQANGANNTAVGYQACVAVTSGFGNTVVGDSAGISLTNGQKNTIIGANGAQSLSGGGSNILLGYGAANSLNSGIDNYFMAGSDTAQIDNVYFGKGAFSATATTYTIHGTDGLGADKVGGQLTLAGGRSTGAGAAASIVFQTAPASGSSSTLNTLATQFTIDPKGNLVCGNAAISTGATDGFLYLVSCAGTPGGTPTAFTGRVPVIIDTSAGKLWAYYGAAWHFALLT